MDDLARMHEQLAVINSQISAARHNAALEARATVALYKLTHLHNFGKTDVGIGEGVKNAELPSARIAQFLKRLKNDRHTPSVLDN